MKAAMNQVERDMLNAKKVNQLSEDIDEDTAIKSFTTSPVLTYRELKIRILAEFPAVMAIIAEFPEIDNIEASDTNFLNRAKQIRPQIQSFLHVCCSKCLWTRDKHPDWVYGFVCVLHRISEIHVQILTLSLAEIRLLFSLHMLFDAIAWDDYDRIPQIFSNCGSAAVVEHFIDVIYSPLPHRGSNCWNLCLIVTGVETKKRKLIEWATDAIRLKVLAAYSATLRDLRSPAECNGWVVSSIGRFIEVYLQLIIIIIIFICIYMYFMIMLYIYILIGFEFM